MPQQCSQEAAAVRTSWRYHDADALKGGDYVCLYIDGMLYDKEVMKSSDPHRATFSGGNAAADRSHRHASNIWEV